MEIQQKLHFRDVKTQVSLNENDSAIELSEANFENGLSWVQLKKLVAEVMCRRAAETVIPANSRLDYKKH